MASSTTSNFVDRERPVSMDPPQAPVVDDRDRLLSVGSTASHVPQTTADAHEKQQDLAAEVLRQHQPLVFGASGAPSPQTSLVDCQGLSRMSAISGISEEPVRSLSPGLSKHPIRSPTDLGAKPLPSPTARVIARTPSLSTTLEQNIEKCISSPVAVSDSLGFAHKTSEAPERAWPKNPVKLPRRSMFIEDFGEQKLGQSEDRTTIAGEMSKIAAATADWPLPTPTASPALGIRFQDSSTAVDGSEASEFSVQSPQQTATPITTVIIPQVKKSPRLNFLPKFLKAISPGEPKIGSAIVESSQAEEAASPQSFFEDESSDGGEDSQIESAQQAIIASPVMVKHGSTSRVGLQEMLSSTPPRRDTEAGASRDRTVKLLSNDLDEKDVRRSSVRSVYDHQHAAISKDASLKAGLSKETFTFSPSRSKNTPLHLTLSLSPSKNPKAPRKVSFPAPSPLDIKPEHRFLRQSIISTPYPSGDDDEPQKRLTSTSGTVLQDEPRGDIESESILTLVIYGNVDTPPKVKRIVIPSRQATSLVDDTVEKHPPINATRVRFFDDEKLFKLIRKEYAGIRGSLRRIASARTVRRINLLSYQSTSQLVSRHAKPMHIDVGEEDGNPSGARILRLFQSPKTGRKRHEWTEWIRSQPENIVETPSDMDHLALELVEGWSPGKLYLAIATVLVCSLAATILWVFIGNRKGGLAVIDAFGAGAQLGRGDVGYRGAGDRVGSGAALGLLVLFFGWTAVGAWMLLSWLL